MIVTIERRELLAALGGAAVAWPLATPGQPTVPVIGFLNGASQNGYAPIETAFLQGLKDAIGSICDRRCGWGPRPAPLAKSAARLIDRTITKTPWEEVRHDRFHRKDDHS
jgi:putative ABC transport system substrate-binding protein